MDQNQQNRPPGSLASDHPDAIRAAENADRFRDKVVGVLREFLHEDLQDGYRIQGAIMVLHEAARVTELDCLAGGVSERLVERWRRQGRMNADALADDMEQTLSLNAGDQPAN